VSPVRRGVKSDAGAVAQRVVEQLSRDARIEPLVCDEFSRPDFEYSLAHSASSYWVDEAGGHLRGHLYGATFDDPLHVRQTWSGPDGYSYEYDNVLDNLLEWAYRAWREQGSTAHLVWALAGNGTQAWVERGYRIVSVRAARTLDDVVRAPWPARHRLRRATTDDLGTALDFDGMIDRAQGVDVASLSAAQRESSRADLVELLDDPECHYYLLEVDAQPAAQCVSFPLPPLRGNFAHTIYVGSLAVDPTYRRRGVATKLVHAVLADAADEAYRYAEVRWHIDNEEATALWSSLGFRPTYVQLRRDLDD
jgi:ribosomal protein S18 acetylase RimI-like enzyme